MELKDETIICIECNKPFIFEKGEQAFFLSKGLISPKRCNECRKARRETLRIAKESFSND